MKYLLFISLFLLSGCNIVKKVFNRNKTSDTLVYEQLDSLQSIEYEYDEIVVVKDKILVYDDEVNEMVIKKKSVDVDIIDEVYEKEVSEVVPVTVIAPPKSNNSRGKVAYSVPNEMKVGKLYNVKLRISKIKKDVEKQIVSGINSNNVESTIEVLDIRIAPIMSAELLDPNSMLEIKELSTNVQSIDSLGYTEWTWSIMPIKSGDIPLKLIVKVKVKVDGESIYKDIPVLEKIIYTKANVKWNLKNFVSNYWQWLMTTLIIPFITFWWKRRKKKEEDV